MILLLLWKQKLVGGYNLNNNKIILDLCGGTGSWSKPYKENGYDVRLITLPDNDVLKYIPPDNVYGILAAPPCTEFSIAKYFHGKGNYTHDIEGGMKIVNACFKIAEKCNPKFFALENPATGMLKNYIGNPKYVFDAWEFGDKYQKKTALWGYFNEPIKTVLEKPEGIKKFSMLLSKEIEPEYYGIYDRTTRRAMTSKYFAKAFYEANK